MSFRLATRVAGSPQLWRDMSVARIGIGMSTPTCPACSGTVINEIPEMAWTKRVTYFRCDECWHVWVRLEDGSLHHVMPLPDRPVWKDHVPPAAANRRYRS